MHQGNDSFAIKLSSYQAKKLQAHAYAHAHAFQKVMSKIL